jgi:hypothetical protein
MPVYLLEKSEKAKGLIISICTTDLGLYMSDSTPASYNSPARQATAVGLCGIDDITSKL